MEPLTLEKFEGDFRPGVQVRFNWDRLLSERWPISVVRVVDRSTLGLNATPWYLGSEGKEVGWSAADARPICYAQIPEIVASLKDSRQKKIETFVDQFHIQSLIELSIPSYDLGGTRQLVLDGNHRLSALFLTDVPFIVTFYSVQGPIDPGCLPDLKYWPPKHA